MTGVRPGRAVSLLACLAVAGCGGTAPQRKSDPLPPGTRPIGPGPRFHQPIAAGVKVAGCRPGPLGPRFGVHLELFGEGLVALFPAGLGTEPPRKVFSGRVVRARCHGPLVTIDPTGLVLLRPGIKASVGDVFALWGRPLGPHRAAAFRGAVRAYVNGHRQPGPPQDIPLRRHDSIVLEVGPYVPPHRRYHFPAGW